MQQVHSRPMVVTDFEDITFLDPHDMKDWRKHSEGLDLQRRVMSSTSINTQDSHASIQSVGSTSSLSGMSDASMVRSSLSSFSSPTLAGPPPFGTVSPPPNTEYTHVKKSPNSKLASISDNNTSSSTLKCGRRRSVPTLLDNTSMASLTIKAAGASRSRKQRELDFDADRDDDIWPADSLMFNVPMSPALYAQQRVKQTVKVPKLASAPRGNPSKWGKHQNNMPPLPSAPPRFNNWFGNSDWYARRNPASPDNTPARPSPLQTETKSSRSNKRHSLPSITENRDYAPSVNHDFDFDFTVADTAIDNHHQTEPLQAPYYRSNSASNVLSSPSTAVSLSGGASRADLSGSSYDGIDFSTDDITLELCKLEERQQSRRSSVKSEKSRHDLLQSGVVEPSISSLALSDSENPLPLPSPNRPVDDDSNSNSSRRSSLTRPENLPPKSPEHEMKHMQEYEQLLKDAAAAEKRKQQKREELAKKRASQIKQDLQTWNQWISKNGSIRLSSNLKWRGIPESVRSQVWFRCRGGDTSAIDRYPLPNTTHTAQIVQDSQTIWSECNIFGPGRPLHDSLVFIVQRFLGLRHEIQYSRSLLTLAALLLLFLDAKSALIVLVNTLEPGSLPFCILSGNERIASANYVSFHKIFKTKFTALSAHFKKKGLTEQELLNPLCGSIFTAVLPTPEAAARLLDVYIFDGDSFLLRAALGLLRINEAWLYGSKSEILAEVQKPRIGSEDDLLDAIREVTRK